MKCTIFQLFVVFVLSSAAVSPVALGQPLPETPSPPAATSPETTSTSQPATTTGPPAVPLPSPTFPIAPAPIGPPSTPPAGYPKPPPPPPWQPPGGELSQPPERKQTDHERIVHQVGVGFFGIRSVTFEGNGSPNQPFAIVSIPKVGIRTWFSKHVGLELAFGSFVSIDPDSRDDVFAFGAHIGLPLAFSSAAHLTPILMPYAEVDVGTDGVREGGIVAEVGLRAGAEVQFGFIGIPELSLLGSIGFALSYTGFEGTARFLATTTVEGQPWDIFVGNIAAIYYF